MTSQDTQNRKQDDTRAKQHRHRQARKLRKSQEPETSAVRLQSKMSRQRGNQQSIESNELPSDQQSKQDILSEHELNKHL